MLHAFCSVCAICGWHCIFREAVNRELASCLLCRGCWLCAWVAAIYGIICLEQTKNWNVVISISYANGTDEGCAWNTWSPSVTCLCIDLDVRLKIKTVIRGFCAHILSYCLVQACGHQQTNFSTRWHVVCSNWYPMRQDTVCKEEQPQLDDEDRLWVLGFWASQCASALDSNLINDCLCL